MTPLFRLQILKLNNALLYQEVKKLLHSSFKNKNSMTKTCSQEAVVHEIKTI